MEKKWCLIKESDGARGAAGKKKIYEVIVSGNLVRFSWGMAEKSTRQTKTEYASNNNVALQIASGQVSAKLGRGYTLAYVV